MRRQIIKSAIRSAQMHPFLQNATGYRTIMSEAPVRRVMGLTNKAENLKSSIDHYGHSSGRSNRDYLYSINNPSRRRSISMPPKNRLDLMEINKELRWRNEKSDLSEFKEDPRLRNEKSNLSALKEDPQLRNEKSNLSALKEDSRMRREKSDLSALKEDSRMRREKSDLSALKEDSRMRREKSDLNEFREKSRFPCERPDWGEFNKDLRLSAEKSDLGECERDFRLPSEEYSGNESALVKCAKTASINKSKNIQPAQSWLGDDRLLEIDKEIRDIIKREKIEKARAISHPVYKKGLSNYRNDVYSFGVDTSKWKAYESEERGKSVFQSAKQYDEPMAAACKLSKAEEQAKILFERKYCANMKNKSSNKISNQAKDAYGNESKTQCMNDPQFDKQNDVSRARTKNKQSMSGEKAKRTHVANNLYSMKPIYNEEAPEFDYCKWKGNSYEQFTNCQRSPFDNEVKHTHFDKQKECETNSYCEKPNHSPVFSVNTSQRLSRKNEDPKYTKNAYDLSNDAKHSTDVRTIYPIYNSEPAEDFSINLVNKNDRIKLSNSYNHEDREVPKNKVQYENSFEQRDFEAQSKEIGSHVSSKKHASCNKRQDNIRKTRKDNSDREYAEKNKRDYEKMEGLTRRNKKGQNSAKQKPKAGKKTESD